MKESFLGYYQPTEEEFDYIWKECLFVFDTNVLIGFYRYSDSIKETLFNIFEEIKERIWIPYQVALEYQHNRLEAITKQQKAYDDIEKILANKLNEIKGELGQYSKHSSIKVNDIAEEIKVKFEIINEKLKEQKEKHPDLFTVDDIRDKLTDLLEGKIGAPYTQKELDSYYKKGKERYERDIPPGFSDKKKEDKRYVGDLVIENKYGDLIIWFQIIEKAKAERKPIILITDDKKDDWWWKYKGKTIGPQPELIHEIKSKAEVSFYMYQPDQFIRYAKKYLDLKETEQRIQDVIDEVKAKSEPEDNKNKNSESEEYVLPFEDFLEYVRLKMENEGAPPDSSLAFDYIERMYKKSLSEIEKKRIKEEFDDLMEISIWEDKIFNFINKYPVPNFIGKETIDEINVIKKSDASAKIKRKWLESIYERVKKGTLNY